MEFVWKSLSVEGLCRTVCRNRPRCSWLLLSVRLCVTCLFLNRVVQCEYSGCNHRVCVDTFKNQGDKILRLFRILNCWFIVVVATNFTSLAFSHSVRDTHCTLLLTQTFYASNENEQNTTSTSSETCRRGFKKCWARPLDVLERAILFKHMMKMIHTPTSLPKCTYAFICKFHFKYTFNVLWTQKRVRSASKQQLGIK